MRDFFWFAVLTVTMAIVGDYSSTMKTAGVTLRSRERAPAESIASDSKPIVLASYTLVP